MHLFVYGTLMRGGWLNKYLEKAEFLGEAVTMEARFDLHTNGSFPCLIEGTHKVEGELYDITPEQLKVLDRAEGYPNLYQRDTIPLGEYGAVEAIAYTYHDFHMAEHKRYKGPLIRQDEEANTKRWVG